MPILFVFFMIPLAAGAFMEYIFCRFPKKHFWRYLPPAAAAILTGTVTAFRYFGWNEGGGGAPIETLLFFPGLPAAGLFIGFFAGWRIWKRLWTPHVIRKKEKK